MEHADLPRQPEPKRRVELPERYLAGVACLVILAVALLLPTFSFGRDQSLYAVVGRGLLHGLVPYRDLWDFKPPGIYAVYALAQGLFGSTMMAPRLLESFAFLCSVAAMLVLSRRWFGSATAGWFGACAAGLAQLGLDFWHTGQPETFAGSMTMVALAIGTSGATLRRRLVAWSVAGMLLGATALLKPPLGGAAIIFALTLVRSRDSERRPDWWNRLLPVLVVGAAAALPTLLCVAWFAHVGGFPAMHWTLGQFVPGYTALGWKGDSSPLEMFFFALVELCTRFSAPTAIGLAMAALMAPVTSREREAWILLGGVAAFHMVGVAMQAKFFQYHYGATIPVIALLGGLGWSKLWSRCRRQVVPALAVGLAFGASLYLRRPVDDVPGSGYERTLCRVNYLLRRAPCADRRTLDAKLHRVADYDLGSSRQVADWILAHSAADQRLLVWGFEPSLYFMTNRAPSTRFIYNVAQRSAWQQAESRKLWMTDVVSHPPAIVVIQHMDIFPGVTGHSSDSAAELPDFPELASFLEQGYQAAGTLGHFELMTRRSPEGAHGKLN